MKRSEIFDNFVKIAQEKGLISKAEEPEHTEKSFSETNPRHDSLSIEQIGKLYNTKAPTPKEMEYKKNIMEIAHPEPVVISPSYDKLNGLVENNIEGQNIRLRIVMKEPDGHLINRKYAEQNLILSLVSIANELDNQNQEELCKLADACLEQAAKKKIEKRGWVAPAAAIAGIVAAFGILYAKQHLRFHSDGWNADYDKTEKEINDLLTSNSNFGVGYDYTPAFLQTVQQLQTVLQEIDVVVNKVMPTLDEVEMPRTGPGIEQQLTQLSQQPATQQASNAVAELRTVMVKNLPFIRKVLSDFSNPSYKQRSIANKGTITSVIDSTDFLHGGAGLVADDFDDVAHALMTLRVDLSNLIKDLKGAQNVQKQLESELQASQSESDLMFEEQAPATATPTETNTPDAPKSGISKLEEETKGIMGGLFGK